jgi:hypothetical protein
MGGSGHRAPRGGSFGAIIPGNKFPGYRRFACAIRTKSRFPSGMKDKKQVQKQGQDYKKQVLRKLRMTTYKGR